MPSTQSLKIYIGVRKDNHELVVTVNQKPLNARLDISNRSPNGFEWGYAGHGPAQLALALLADHLDNDGLALAFHESFMLAVVVKLPRDRWTLTCEHIQSEIISLVK